MRLSCRPPGRGRGTNVIAQNDYCLDDYYDVCPRGWKRPRPPISSPSPLRAAACRHTTTHPRRQRRRLVSMNYASDLRFASRRRNGAPRRSDQGRDRDSTEFNKLLILKRNQYPHRDTARSRLDATFLRRSRDFAAIFDGLHENSVMHCTKQEGDPGV
jgi:hypothetical protein